MTGILQGTRLLALIALFAVGCSGSTGQRPTFIGSTEHETVRPKPKLAPRPKRTAPPSRDLRRFATAYHGVRASDGVALEPSAVMDDLSQADVICFGEDHDDARHHWLQLRILRELLRRSDTSGREVALGMEMFEKPAQPVLDEYLSEKGGDEEALLRKTNWDHRWRHDSGLYRPLVRAARRRGIPIVALNAPAELTHKVARRGLRSLTEAERKELPHLDLHDAKHRAAFDEALKAHPHHGRPRRLYAAQVIWDETMAKTAADWLSERQPARQLLILAGAQHCRADAIPDRIRRRVSSRVVGVRPVLANTGVNLPTLLESYDYALVLESDEALEQP
jgi:uncharacterized iron-regulated protein